MSKNQLTLPPQVKYGVAIIELYDGRVVRVPINPNDMKLTIGQIIRLVHGELEDLRAEHMAAKILALTGGGQRAQIKSPDPAGKASPSKG